MEPNEAPEGVVDGSFVRKSFYLEPPAKTATVEEWEVWQAADRQAAIQAKRAYTKAQAYGEAPEALRPQTMVKVGGVWKQGALSGWTGSAEDGSLAVDPGVEATQERDVRMTPWNEPKRGGNKRTTNSRRKARAIAKAAKK